MNEDILKSQWKQIRGQIKGWWSVLTDEDLDRINGRRDQLIKGMRQSEIVTSLMGEDIERTVLPHITQHDEIAVAGGKMPMPPVTDEDDDAARIHSRRSRLC